MSIRKHPNRHRPVKAGDYEPDNIREQIKHTHNGPEVPRKAGKAKKNTKKWCKGVVGREHEPTGVWQTSGYRTYMCVLECQKCGKHLDYWYDIGWSWRKKTPRPDWVPKKPGL